MRRAAIAVLVLLYAGALAAGWLAPHDYAEQYRESASAPPSAKFPLGTDALGRDLLSRTLYGSRVSLLLAPAAALIATSIAALLAALPGIGRISDLVLSLPWLFLLLTVRAMLPLNTPPVESVWITFLVLGLLGWAAPAKVAAAAVRRLRDSDFVMHARASGAQRIFLRHILPNLRPVLAAQFWISIPVFILAEANLGFLGLGVGEPLPSWGSLLRDLQNIQAVRANPCMLAPLALLLATVGSLHFALSGGEPS